MRKLLGLLFAIMVASSVATSAFAQSSDGAAQSQTTEKKQKKVKASKNISDGAAKGQASEGTAPKQGSGNKTDASKNVSDGAAKGQASEGTAPKQGNGKQGKDNAPKTKKTQAPKAKEGQNP